jgi:hypothetical protein
MSKNSSIVTQKIGNKQSAITLDKETKLKPGKMRDSNLRQESSLNKSSREDGSKESLREDANGDKMGRDSSQSSISVDVEVFVNQKRSVNNANISMDEDLVEEDNLVKLRHNDQNITVRNNADYSTIRKEELASLSDNDRGMKLGADSSIEGSRSREHSPMLD